MQLETQKQIQLLPAIVRLGSQIIQFYCKGRCTLCHLSVCISNWGYDLELAALKYQLGTDDTFIIRELTLLAAISNKSLC